MNPSCPRCGEPLFSDDRFCPACGQDPGGSVGVAPPPSHPSFGTPAGLTPNTPSSGSSGAAVACSDCGRTLGPVQRFCPKCGTPRPGIERKRKAKGGWREIVERLKKTTAGRYEILRELGRGGMATVYLAHETALNRRVAIKVMRPDLLLDDMMVERFLREARTMASFQHPNIVGIYAVESRDDLHYFVMQYIAGRSLDSLIRETGPLPVAVAQSVVYQAASALTYAHRTGVIHRDIKPANILIDQSGNAIVTDFGIAKVADAVVNLTTGQMGTPLYMSPEQCAGTALTPASDQYALGNIAYEMLAGQPPFRKESAIALALAITTEPPKLIKTFRDDCPEEIDQAVLRMLAKSPERRWTSLLEAATAIGGEHLPEDDPVRSYLAALARAQASPESGRALTPRSPRTSSGELTSALRLRNKVRRSLQIAAGVLLVAGAAYVLTRPKATLPSPAPVAPVVVTPAPPTASPTATDSAPEEDPASIMRRRLEAAQAAMAKNDWQAAAREARAVLALDEGNPEATQLMAEIWKHLPEESPGDTSRVVTVLLPAPQPPSPSREAGIRRAINQYGQAINQRSLAQVRAVFPALPADQEARWLELFAPGVTRLRATVAVRSIAERAGGLADVMFLLTLTYQPAREPAKSTRLASVATLKFESGRWRITALTTRAE